MATNILLLIDIKSKMAPWPRNYLNNKKGLCQFAKLQDFGEFVIIVVVVVPRQERKQTTNDQFWTQKQKSDSHDIQTWLLARDRIGINHIVRCL